MPTFVEKSNCRGVAPESMRSSRHVLRPHIIGELLRDRGVPRLLVAPTGYGKSTVAFEYAQLIFGFEHVFWLHCDSPCFLRDLDARSLAGLILDADPEAKLVVCDDIPSLDLDRVELFSGFLRELEDSGCEAIATCIPSCDGLVSSLRNAIVVDACELLLTDEEIGVEDARGNSQARDMALAGDCSRAAAMLWSPSGADSVVEGIKREELPASMRLLVLGILLLGDGSLSSLSRFADARTLADDLAFLERRYPYLGIDIAHSSFNAIDVTCEALRGRGRLSLSGLAPGSACKDADALVYAIADALLDGNSALRASAFLLEFASKAQACRWLLNNGWRLVMDGDMLAVLRLAGSVRVEMADARLSLDVLCAWALYGIGDDESLLAVRRRMLASPSGEWGLRCACAIIGCTGFAPDEAVRTRELIEVGMSMSRCDSDASKEMLASSPIDWECLFGACARLLELVYTPPVAGDAPSRLLEHLQSLLSVPANPQAFAAGCLVAAWSLRWALGAADERSGDSGSRCASDGWRGLAETLKHALEDDACTAGVDDGIEHGSLPRWVWHECALAVDAASASLPDASLAALSPSCGALLRSGSAELSQQLTEHRRDVAEHERVASEKLLTLPDSPLYDKAMRASAGNLRSAIPLLHISLFGGFDAYVGDDASGSRILSRKKAKITLAMLVLSKGREVSRERMTEVLWPDSTFESRQRNFYVVWSDLRRALMVDSSCPYLIRTQTGYRIDRRHVTSDLDGFDRLCHDLFFGDDDASTWRGMFDKVSGDYSEDLLPGMVDNRYINSMRQRLRTQLVDGLVSASVRMRAVGEHHGAIWLAREALRRDPSREDAYIAMMEAQLCADQRGSALETYFDCRRSLSEGLGIDPSPKIMEIYRSIIESEEVF